MMKKLDVVRQIENSEKQFNHIQQIEQVQNVFLSTLPSNFNKKQPSNIQYLEKKILFIIMSTFNILKDKQNHTINEFQSSTSRSNLNNSSVINNQSAAKFQKTNKDQFTLGHSNKTNIKSLYQNGKRLWNYCERLAAKKNTTSAMKGAAGNEAGLSTKTTLILLKGYCCLLSLNVFLLNVDSSYQVLSLPEFESMIETLKQQITNHQSELKQKNPNILKSLLAFCFSQIFSFTTLQQYSMYNINTNEEYKYNEETQIEFLFDLSMIKLSEHLCILKILVGCQNNLQLMAESKQLKIKRQIFKEGKQLLSRCERLINSKGKSLNNSSKISLLQKRLAIIKPYVKWIEQKWLEKLSKIFEGDLEQMPLELLPIYELFYLIYKLGQFETEQQSVKSNLINEIQQQALVKEIKNKQSQIAQVKEKLDNFLNQYRKKAFQSNQKTNEKEEKSFQNTFILFQSFMAMLNKYLGSSQKSKKEYFIQINNVLSNPSFIYMLKRITQEKPKKQPQPIKPVENVKKNPTSTASSKQYGSKQPKTSIILEKDKVKQLQKLNTNINNKESDNISVHSYLSKSSKNINHQIDKKVFIYLSLPLQQMLMVCKNGQQLTKFNFGNSSFAIKFVKISANDDKIYWCQNKENCNEKDASTYKLSKVTGIVYGDVTEKFISHCEKSKGKKHQIQPWRCFSLICQDRTLDFYCHINQYDVFFWIQGIAQYLRSTHKRKTNYSRGKILWKKILLKLKYEFLPARPKQSKQRFYIGRDNARAIVNFSVGLKLKQKQSKLN